jgi:hypothetical protein
VTSGVVDTVKPVLKTAVIVSPAASAPVALALNPTVQVEWERAVCGEPAKVTVAGSAAAPIVAVKPGLAAVVSALVLTLKVFAA